MPKIIITDELSLIDAADATKRKGLKKLRTSGSLSTNSTEVSADSVVKPAIDAGAGSTAQQVNATTAAAKPAVSEAKINYVTDTDKLEVSDGVGWNALATESWVNAQTIGASGNKMNALNIMDYGGVSNASVPASGNNATGTDNGAALAAMLTASAAGQPCIIPNGNYRFSTGVTVTSKRILLIVYGSVYVDEGVTLVTLTSPGGGAYVQHRVCFFGNAIGRNNMASLSKSAYDAGTGNDWTTFTSHLVKIISLNQCVIETNKCEGFKAPVCLQAGAGLGGQENTIAGRFWYKNAYGVYMVNTDGVGYMDKNVWTGINNGCLRISGGTAIKIDGFSGTEAVSGEVFNGAFRSNHINVLIEQVEELATCEGDITEQQHYITIEGGQTTGVYSPNPFNMRIASPNPVRAPYYKFGGVITPQRLGYPNTSTGAGGMGQNAVIEGSMWTVGSTAYIGRKAYTDSSGNVIIEASYAYTKANRDLVTGTYPYVKFIPGKDREDTTVQTGSAYTPTYGIRRIYADSTNLTVTLPSVTTSVDRYITIINNNAVNSVVVTSTALKTGNYNTVAAQKSITYWCDGTNWFSLNKD